MLKTIIRKIARRMSNWPLIGPYVYFSMGKVKIALGFFKLLIKLPKLLQLLQLPNLLETISDINQRQLSLDKEMTNIVKSIPVSLRTLKTDFNDTKQNQQDQAQTLSYLLERVEFVRRELMFEMRYNKPSQTEQQSLQTEAKILSAEKLATARHSKLKLNLGCGHIAKEDYINIDRRALPGIDIVAEVNNIPLQQGEVDEIYSAHLIEHFPQEQVVRELLPHWIELLKPNGILIIIAPDADAMMKSYVAGAFPYESLREVTFGAQDYEGDFHYNMYTPESLKQLLLSLGLDDVQVIEAGRKNGACYEFEISAARTQKTSQD